MKNFRLFAAVAAFAMIAFTSSINAQAPKQGKWQERVMAEKIAYITVALELTPEEAQVFWPVYTQIDASKKELQKNVRAAYKALNQALEEGTASDKEINSLLDTYLAAKQAQKESGKGDVNQYRKVLPAKKVAKLYIAEEDFRKNQLRDMKAAQGHGPKGGHGRPEPRR